MDVNTKPAEENSSPKEENDSPKEKTKFVWKKQYSVLAALVLVIAGALGYYQFVYSKSFLTADKAKAKAMDFINNNLVQPGTKVDITAVTSESGLYKMAISVGEQKVDAYMTKDGKVFFPQAIDIAEAEKKSAEAPTEPAAPVEIPKSDKPDVQLFVMSYCPYGTQVQKGILPVLDALKTKIKYEQKFVSYIMHEKKEIDENLNQYCIQKNEPAKFNAYLKCFLKDGKSEPCLSANAINTFKLKSCVAAADKEFKITESYNDKSTWSGGQYPIFNVNKEDNTKFQVGGSPTLIINGVDAQPSGRDSASILKTICSAFNNPPKECETQLSSAQPTPGFGEGTAAASTGSASCGN